MRHIVYIIIFLYCCLPKAGYAYTFTSDASTTRVTQNLAEMDFQYQVIVFMRNRAFAYNYWLETFLNPETDVLESIVESDAFGKDFTIEASSLLILEWTRLKNPELRKAFLYRWGISAPYLVSPEQAENIIRQCCSARQPKEIDDRIEEYKMVYPLVKKEVLSFQRRIFLSITTAIPIVDFLASASTITLYSAVLDPSPGKRRKTYISLLAKADELRTKNPKCQDAFDTISELLWLYEPEKELRRKYVIPLLRKAPSFHLKSRLRMLSADLNDKQRTDRIQEINSETWK